MEELRALVRKWNLHHKRNFWRENPTKDDVVAALNRHIKHMKLINDNIENKKAERREADRKRQVQNTPGDGSSRLRVTSPPRRCTQVGGASSLSYQGFTLPCLGRPADLDMPVDSVENGLIYMSRWGQESTRADDHTNRGMEQVLTTADVESERTRPLCFGSRQESVSELRDSSNIARKMKAQQKCSLALLNMTMRDQVKKRYRGANVGNSCPIHRIQPETHR